MSPLLEAKEIIVQFPMNDGFLSTLGFATGKTH